MTKQDNTYRNCFYCDNIISHRGQTGLLYLDFPRCFVLVTDPAGWAFSTYETFQQHAKVHWLDPNDKGTPEEREAVLAKLWNFSIEEEREEEALMSDNDYDD